MKRKVNFGGAIGVLIAGLVYLLVVWNARMDAKNIDRNGYFATGKVVGFAVRGRATYTISTPIVEFVPIGSEESIEAEVEHLGDVRIGSQVGVIYHKNDPTKAIAADYNPRSFGIGDLLATLISGVGLILLMINISWYRRLHYLKKKMTFEWNTPVITAREAFEKMYRFYGLDGPESMYRAGYDTPWRVRRFYEQCHKNAFTMARNLGLTQH